MVDYNQHLPINKLTIASISGSAKNLKPETCNMRIGWSSPTKYYLGIRYNIYWIFCHVLLLISNMLFNEFGKPFWGISVFPIQIDRTNWVLDAQNSCLVVL